MMSKNQRYRAVLFDFDGTYADTAPDMIGALNELRKQDGLSPVPYEAARPQVSHGSRALVNLGFPDAQGDEQKILIKRFLDAYENNIAEHTRPFDGMEAWTAQFNAHDVAWGIVTNKPGYLTRQLLELAPPKTAPMCVVTGDCLIMRKPHPMPVLHAAALLRVPADACIYVGDARSDITSGRAAGMYTVAASYGYILPNDSAHNWHADAVVHSIEELINTINPLIALNA